MQQIRANGKILLSGEYGVLDGAQSLALPTQLGQIFRFEKINEPEIQWKSLFADNSLWFEVIFKLENNQLFEQITPATSEIIRLKEILEFIFNKNPDLTQTGGYKITSQLEFDKDWGLGSSSTLIYALSKWAGINAYELLENTFGGSGYDLACADASTAILYKKTSHPYTPNVQPIHFTPHFKEQLFFVYLNEKKNSREAIAHYQQLEKNQRMHLIEAQNRITQNLLTAQTLTDFEAALEKSESVLSRVLDIKTVKEERFKDYPYTIKSLGGWGGDFVLVTTRKAKDMDYFIHQGYTNYFSFQDFIK
ncbi:GYDIA family GHMP kinase [Mesonia sp. HuA40]|uniref:GYDIA family GHMP kinase n=1 Tax=Mesonia sp. HuA40 TaxID=2602761 RepID=UPI0011CB27E2|nr:GYDIA family GHMP kinase [Mesonia sp. HuA40]TXK71587.1 GHMP kinase [Mesonia sp. HuA40]